MLYTFAGPRRKRCKLILDGQSPSPPWQYFLQTKCDVLSSVFLYLLLLLLFISLLLNLLYVFVGTEGPSLLKCEIRNDAFAETGSSLCKTGKFAILELALCCPEGGNWRKWDKFAS